MRDTDIERLGNTNAAGIMPSQSLVTTIDQWNSSASVAGFSRFDTISEDSHGRSMHIATAIDDSSYTPASLDVCILAPVNLSAAFESLSSALCTLLGQPITARSSDICALAEVSGDGKTCICLAELEESILDSCDEVQWTSIQKMLSSASRVLWITRGETMSARYAEASLITGIARSARSDNEALHLVTLDLDLCQKSAEDTARIILNILHTSFNTQAEE